MLPCFEGNETEQNWIQRQQCIDELRKMMKNGTLKDCPAAAFVTGAKLLLDGIIKCAESLRTTLSTNGCKAMQELVIKFGPFLDPPMVEKILPAFISLC